MQIVRSKQANKILSSPSTTIHEYLMDEKALSGAKAHINGKYPDVGYAHNGICKELAYILTGSGKVITPTQTADFQTGDTIFINIGELFRWEGNFTMYVMTSPKFDPNQHFIVL